LANLFLFLSGEHADLPFSEVEAILEAEDYKHKFIEKLDQVLRLEADIGCVEALKCRAAFTRMCGLELFNCEAEMSNIMDAAKSTELNEVLDAGESFVVRVRNVKEHASDIDRMALERKIGALLINKRPGAKVNLRNPDKVFTGVLTDHKLIFGVRLAELPAKPFVERRPRKKPFFHPSAMQAKLARCMVNLARPKAGELVLDPFCGTGTMLIEAKLVGCRVVGLDIQRRMARGTLKNMAHFRIEPEGIIVADAQSPPLLKVDCVVTDPPYGTSATTLKRTTKQIVEQVLTAVHSLLRKGQNVCMAMPSKINMATLAANLGYKHLQSHFVYVHRSLTREIAVFEKV
jgi:tRNA (guanine10-N2)-dimethyltransferase